MRFALIVAAMLAGTLPKGALREVCDLAPGTRGIVITEQRGGAGSRLMLLKADGTAVSLTAEFHAAADPEISWDGRQLLFAAQKRATDHWQIYEMPVAGGSARQVLNLPYDCRHPFYQSTVYVISADRPWRQIGFVAAGALYSARFDGGDVQRLTWHEAPDSEPQMLPDGRIVFVSGGGLFGVNADGTDFAEFAAHEGQPGKRMPAVTTSHVVFIEGGSVSSVSLRRPLHSYQRLTQPRSGSFAWPSPLPDGTLLVSRKTTGGRWELCRLYPASGNWRPLFSQPGLDILQAKLITARPEPDGRSSVVDSAKATGKLYCLSVHTTDKPWTALAKRLRVMGANQRELGSIDLEPDGSFQVEIPANTPVQLEVLDAEGRVGRRCSQVWVRNNEHRGCIGCHEDGELSPENRMADALSKPAGRLGLGDKP